MMHLKSRTRRAAALAAAAMLLMTACGGASSSQQSADTQAAQESGQTTVKDSVTYRKLSDQTTYDPYGSSDQNQWEDMYKIFDTLFREDELGVFVPNLVSDYSFSEDGTELTMTLVDGVKFHNGETMTADDVVFSLNTSIASSYTGRFTSMMDHCEKVDDSTVKLVLKYAFSPILGCLVNATTSIVPQASYDPEKFATEPIGSGPYTIGEIVTGEKYVYEAFPDYFRGEAPVKTVVARVIADNNAALMALESGELDVMQPNQDYSDRQAIEDNPDLAYYTEEQACSFLIGFNNEKGVFTDQRLRDAVALAIDKEEIALGATNGYAVPTDVAIPPICPQIDESKFEGQQRDVEKAKALVAEAGYPNGLDVTMRIISASNYKKPAEVVQAELKEIGINVTIEDMERASWFDICYDGGDFDITIYANPIHVIDADFAAYTYMHSESSANFCRINDPELDALIEQARMSSDETERAELYMQICEIMDENNYYIPMYTGQRTYAAVKDLKGVKADPMMRYYTYQYSWE